MAVSAYQIGISFVSNAEGVTGPLDKIIAALRRVQEAQRAAQMGFNEMASGLRGASRTADALASTMERIARSASDAARATSRIRVAGGSGDASGGSAPASRPRVSLPPLPVSVPSAPSSYVSPYSAAASVAAAANGGPLPMLTYDPRVPSQALTTIGGQGDSFGSGASFRGAGTGYRPNFTTGSAPPPGALAPYLAAGAGMPPLTGGAFVQAAGLGPNVAKALKMPPLPSMASVGKVMGAYAGYETLKGAFEQGADVDNIIAKMQAMQVMSADGQPTAAFTGAQIDQSKNQAMQTMRRVPGLGYGQGLDVILQTAGLLGSSDKALALAPQLSFNAQVLSRYGKGDAIAQIEKGVQAGELTGLTGKDGQIDVPRLTDFVNRLTRTTVAMGGQLDIGKYLTGIRQFGLGAESADMDFTTATLPAYMKIMGESKAGTALTSLQQVLLAPVPKTRATQYQQEQERIGIRDKRGELVNPDLLKSNAQDYFVRDILPALNKAGFRTPGQITEEIQRLFPRQTVDRLAGAGIMDRALIDKEVNRNLAQQRAGDAPLATMLGNAPGAQFKAFAEGFKALEAVATDAAMGPAMDIIRRLTVSFQNMTDYVKAHPNDVKMFAEDVDSVLKVLLRVVHVVGDVWSYLPGPLKQAVAGAAVGGALASVVPGVGTASGALVGGVGGLAKGLYDSMGSNKPDSVNALPSGLSYRLPFQKESYERSSVQTMQPVNINVLMDGQVVARSVTHHQVQAMRSGVLLGTNGPDFLAQPMPAGLRTA